MAENTLLQAYTLHDLNGRILLQDNIAVHAQQQEIDVAALKPGMYILHLRTSEGYIYKRIIKH